jgi:hypothetical protein
MRYWTVLIGLLAAVPLHAQQAQPPVTLDSATVVRLHWTDGREKARLLAPLGPGTVLIRYCRYPSPVCGESTINPPRSRSPRDLTRVDLRRGSQTMRGALIGAGFGALVTIATLRLADAIGDAPRQTDGQQVLTVVTAAGVWGAIGALIGAHSDRWVPLR